jgi:hypothetical protein
MVMGASSAVVGFRALIAAFPGIWQGLSIAVAALIVVVFRARNSDPNN